MPTDELQKEKKTKSKGDEDIKFKCQCCDKFKGLEEMRVLTRFFPLLVVCRDCEGDIR